MWRGRCQEEKRGWGSTRAQLYFVIKGIKTDADTQPEDRLKKALLGKILGEAAVYEARHDGKDYFCATPDDWERALDFRPKSRDV